MDNHLNSIIQKRIDKTLGGLKKNNIGAYYAKNRQMALDMVSKLLPLDGIVSVGGSVTLRECGIIDLLRNGQYRFLDRHAAGLSPKEVEDIYIQSFSADAYLCSTNAVTENGELYNVDGTSNRVAAMLYGPRSVIVVAGIQKIVRDIDEAVLRVKRIAAPANCVRLSLDTFCANKGECLSDSGCRNMTEGCRSDSRPCCNYVVMAHQRIKGRVKVILVGEPLGY